MFILLSCSHFEFYSFKPHIFTNFQQYNLQYFLRIRSRVHVCAVPGGEPKWYCAFSAHVLKLYPISKWTTVTARGWPYQQNSAHYHRRYTVHRTHWGFPVQSNVTYNRRGTEVCSSYLYCCGKEIYILYSYCVSLVSYAARKAHCGLSGSRLFFTLSLKPHDISKNVLTLKCVFSFSVQQLLKYFSF